MIPAKDFKKRMVVEIDGHPHLIEQIVVQTPSARGAATLYKIKARNLKSRQRVDKTYKGTDGLKRVEFRASSGPVPLPRRGPIPLHGRPEL